MKALIDKAITTANRLKKDAVNTELFLVYHSQYTTLLILKEMGFDNISVGEGENVNRDR
jgi:hypothetical protein